ncbi:MAG: type IV secretion protein IcmB [Alphaproteobacteria bacterium]|nr:type IV secretion protein IcmB [Alphaproteobacteria bacterium]
MLEIFDQTFASLMMSLRQPVESFIQLETADDRITLVASDGSLVSLVKMFGARQIIGDTEYAWIIDQATLKLGSRFDRPGYAMQVYFMRDPSTVDQDIERVMKSNRSAARAMELDVGDLLNERRRHLARFMAHEEIYLALWTRPSVLTPAELSAALKQRGKKKWAVASDAQFPMQALEALRSRHKSYVSSIASALEEIGMKIEVLSTHEALAAVRSSLYPQLGHEDWRANLPGDPVLPRAPQHGRNDASDLLWPPLRRQICTGDAAVTSPSTVRIGSLLWGGVDMTLAPAEPSPFPQLLARLIDNDVPFRMSFLIESAGVQGSSFRAFAAGVLGFTNQVNKQIRESLLALQKLSQSEPVVKMRVSLATYAPQNDRKLIESRVGALTQAVEAWGYCQASSAGGDPLEVVLSSALGIACASTAPPVVLPFHEAVKLLPWQRASSPFQEGSVIFRTADGRMWPYQSGSNLTSLWFDLIFAQPGAGKSVLMNALNLGTILSAGTARLPYVAVLDIGPSSAGLISLIRDALPLERRHEALHFKLRMTPDYAINPFDTQLGCRYPLPEERAYLTELITLLCTPPGQMESYDGMTQLVGLCIDEMYRWRDDSGANTEPRPYLVRIETDVDEAIAKYDIHLPTDPYWWDVVDALFEKGAHHEAMLAQRHAAPTLVDAVTAARRPQIRALLEETQIGASAESVIHAFERMIASAVREFPILASVTRYDIGGARVVAVDLQDVAPQGDANADRQTAIMYMLARHAMVRSWWLGPDMLRSVPEKYRTYHEARIRDIRETPKRICFDEFHRTSKTTAVRAQVIRDVREGRKWGVQIVLASQLLDDFTKDMVDLATGVWICGTAVSDRAIADTAERFGLSDTARWVMRYRLTGPRATGAPVLLLLSTNEGRYEQHLVNTLGPIELWALSTSVEDVMLRNTLYTALGAPGARQLLARFFPGGSARSEVRRRVVLRTEKGEVESGAMAVVVQEIAQEIINQAHKDPAKTMVRG